MKKAMVILFMGFIWSCTRQEDFILKQKDLIPEGTAFNTKTNTLYVGSIYKQKVVGIEADGTEKDIITKENFGVFSPLGMEMDNRTNTLWVNGAVAPIVQHPPGTKRQTAVLAFNPTTNQLIKKMVLDIAEPAMLNDLTLDEEGNVYSTETLSHKIFWVEKGSDKLVLYKALDTYHHPNGILFYKPKNSLFIATDEGIVQLELESKKITLLEAKEGVDTRIIDGLTIYEDYFIGHQSTKVSKFYFDDDMTRITKAETLDSGEAFDSSTTGELGNGHYYYIVNSQLKSGIDRAIQSVKPLDSLEYVIIRRKKL
ncbi:MAG: hypothetical protein ABJO02_19620 [Reichenbachiella sp.]|uniref:hypothetical protein n=2 Tax=Reichenbachiella sp. TaxID=2184521 RepID=UPI0032975ADC